MDEDRVIQLETSDISWSVLIVRFGIVGTIIYLIFFFTLVSFFWKRRKIRPYMPPLLYLLFILVTSVTYFGFSAVWTFAPIVFLNIIQEKKISTKYKT
jgi:heme A synthase